MSFVQKLQSKEEVKKGSKFGMPVPVIHGIWDEEAPPCNPKRKDLIEKEQLKVISMLVAMETKDSSRIGAIMVIAKKFGLAHAEQKLHVSWV